MTKASIIPCYYNIPIPTTGNVLNARTGIDVGVVQEAWGLCRFIATRPFPFSQKGYIIEIHYKTTITENDGQMKGLPVSLQFVVSEKALLAKGLLSLTCSQLEKKISSHRKNLESRGEIVDGNPTHERLKAILEQIKTAISANTAYRAVMEISPPQSRLSMLLMPRF